MTVGCFLCCQIYQRHSRAAILKELRTSTTPPGHPVHRALSYVFIFVHFVYFYFIVNKASWVYQQPFMGYSFYIYGDSMVLYRVRVRTRGRWPSWMLRKRLQGWAFIRSTKALVFGLLELSLCGVVKTALLKFSLLVYYLEKHISQVAHMCCDCLMWAAQSLRGRSVHQVG